MRLRNLTLKLKKKSLLLLSGGLDSAAQCAFCHEQDHPVLALTFDYGQKASLNECKAAQKIADYYQIPHKVISLPFFKEFGKSSLLVSHLSLPHIKMSELENKEVTLKSAQNVWVPNRNGIFINITCGYAESLLCDQVIVGFNKEEAATFPDNSENFIHALNQSLFFSTSNQIKIFSYTTHLTKNEIVQKLNLLKKKFPMELVWSCYSGESEPCGECESCLRLLRAKGEFKDVSKSSVSL